MGAYTPSETRYEKKDGWFRRCGRSGLMLPAVSLGMWHNFADPPEGTSEGDWHENARAMCFTAFDHGVTHFDLANNYGPPPGGAEIRVGRILKEMPRDELIVSSKAGYRMGPGPYGEWGSRKYLLSSLDASLKRLGLDYVDIFYHHRPDPETPMEESLTAVADAVRMGKALYAGVSNYPAELASKAATFLRSLNVPLVIHQPRYNILERAPETTGLLTALEDAGVGCIAFCPLAQGLLTDRYLAGIPEGSRAATPGTFLPASRVTDEVVAKARQLASIAKARGQSLAQMALSWVLRRPAVTSALIGASRVSQIEENIAAASRTEFSDDELAAIDAACGN